jgi:signal transduction histidine kinase
MTPIMNSAGIHINKPQEMTGLEPQTNAAPDMPELIEAWERQETLSLHHDLLIFTLDAQGHVTYLGGRSRDILGLTEGDRREFRDVFRNFPDVLPRIELAYAGKGGTWSVQMHNRVWELHLMPCKDLNEKVVRVHGLAKNVTQRHDTEARMRWHERELTVLHALSSEMNSTLNFDEVVRSLRRQLDLLFDIRSGALYLLDFKTFDISLHQAWNLSPQQAEGVMEHVALRLFPPPRPGVEDAIVSPHTLPRDLLDRLEPGDDTGPQGFKSGFIVPLISREMLLGGVVLFSHDPSAFYRHHRHFYEMLGQQIGAALQNARLHRNVTENREQLQHLTRRLVDAQEDERGRLARELHDELGQMLTCLKISLELAEKPDTSPEVSGRHRREAHTTVAELLDRVRQMSLQLRPTVLDDIGLMPTLSWHIERFESQTGISVHLSQADVTGCRFPHAIETTAYRIVQEALTNIARHARTTESWVDLRIIPHEERGPALDILIEDNGDGFDPTTLHMSSGVSGMRERAIAVGGTLRIISRPGAGTRVEAHLPLMLGSHNINQPDGAS